MLVEKHVILGSHGKLIFGDVFDLGSNGSVACMVGELHGFRGSSLADARLWRILNGL